MSRTAIIINVFAFTCLALALVKDRARTRQALAIAARSLRRILPSVLMIVLLIGLVLGFTSQATISRMIGDQAGVGGIFWAAVLGSILHIPSIIAFPLAGKLLISGASATVIATFITTLTMIGVVTFPLEVRELGRRFALLRNGIGWIAAVAIGLLIGYIL